MTTALAVRHMVKTYPGVRALKDVSFEVAAGSVHALLGENGAGKSTLIRIVSGAEAADTGAMEVGGRPYTPSSPAEAIRAGVSTLYQEQNLLPDRSVMHNVLMTGLPRRFGVLTDVTAARRVTREALDRVGATHVRPTALVGRLSVADRQMVDIARALHRQSTLLIMDEPTAALSSREVDALFRILGDLPGAGIAVLFVSHRMEEIFRLCDAVTVLRDGVRVRSSAIADLTPDDLVESMVGAAARSVLEPRKNPATATPVLRARGLRGPGLWGVDLDVNAGEIVALTGVTGSGKEQVGSTLLGAIPMVHGTVEVDGVRVRLNPRRAMAVGVVGVPSDRKAEGVIGELSVRRNLSLPSLPSLTRLGFLRSREERALAGRRIDELAIKIRDQDVPVAQLSGGNQQKVALGKWLRSPPRLLVLMEPTQGIDIKVRFDFYRLIRKLADDGAGVLLVSSDIPEVLTLADRIVVMRGGLAVGQLLGEPTAEEVVRLSLGQSSPDDAATLRTIDDAVQRTEVDR